MPNSVEKTMMILRAVSDGKGEPVSLERISAVCGINKSTASHILKVLSASGYLRRVSHSLGYITGPELHMLTRYGRYGEDIITECHPILEHLHKKCGGTAVFSVLADGKKYIIDRVSDVSLYSDNDASILGDDLYRTVTGRVLLAAAPLDAALSVYDSIGAPRKGEWNEARTRDSFISELSHISRLSCYSCINESVGNYSWLSFACAVRRGGMCVGAIGLALRYESNDMLPCKADIEKIRKTVTKSKTELERRLDFDT